MVTQDMSRLEFARQPLWHITFYFQWVERVFTSAEFRNQSMKNGLSHSSTPASAERANMRTALKLDEHVCQAQGLKMCSALFK